MLGVVVVFVLLAALAVTIVLHFDSVPQPEGYEAISADDDAQDWRTVPATPFTAEDDTLPVLLDEKEA